MNSNRNIRIVLSIWSLVISALASAQNEVPNFSFEEWSGLHPDLWIGTSPNITSSSDAHHGLISVKGEVHPENKFVVLYTAEPFPVSQDYNYFTGYYKFFPKGAGDTLYIDVRLWNDGADLNLKHSRISIGAPVSEWTRFEVPLTGESGTKTQGSIEFYISNIPRDVPHDGTYVLLDNLELSIDIDPVDTPKIAVIREFTNANPAFNKFKGVASSDFNGDGIEDIAVIQGSACRPDVFDPKTTFCFRVYDPITQIDVWEHSFAISDFGPGSEDTFALSFISVLDFSGNKYALFTVEPDGGNKIIAILIGIVSNEVAYQAEGRVVSILELPGGKPAIVTFTEQDNIFKIIGEVGGDSNSLADIAADYNDRRSYPTQANYDLTKKYQAEPGLRLAYDPDLFDPRGDMDVDGDGRLDIPMMIRNQNGVLTGLVVRSGATLEVLWEFPFPPGRRAEILKGFHGFADVDGNGEKEAIIGENLAVTLDGTVHTIAENFVTLDVNDIDGDGYEDIIGLNTLDSTIVVYGILNPTSVTDYDPARIHFQLFQNYPNPFNPSTTISYSVAEAGEVGLNIFNTLGQSVRTLVNGRESAGEYSISWDGRDDAGRIVSSGLYFYRLQVGEAVQTKRMLFLK